ncbi:hypothetical protein Mal15_66630 [Stieleria maiorica]|uniref:Uncharacterized protein n=1 Tax=Stieleria maiorica TaxID=2795974 RepID=A0A5B9MMB5_9BACT|nr:hypothetical protein [Stieleria maiorica]QEG02542.1 hypothetical protein Mal15_66630 [Stieleria maiorica]
MDQEPDTTNHARSSRPGRFRPEKPTTRGTSASDAPQGTPEGSASASGPGNEHHHSGGFHEIPAPATDRVDPETEALPTLFELPDRTPEGLQRKRQSDPFFIHDAHNGPPASHVDPPSGNHSYLSHPEPFSPVGSDSALPGGADHGSDHGQGYISSPAEAAAPTEESRVAAFHGEPMKWATAKASWATRSAIVMLVLLLVSVAFLFGRSSNSPSDPTQLTDVDGDDLGETVVVITEDFDISDDPSSSDPIQQIAATDDIVTPEVATQENQTPSTEALPSYIAEAPTPSGGLGEPSASLPAESLPEEIAQALLDTPGPLATDDIPEVPPSLDSNQSVVAYRSSETDAVSDPLPAGMEDRLRLEDGLRYSDTPYAIGNFLEILKAWEESATPQ